MLALSLLIMPVWAVVTGVVGSAIVVGRRANDRQSGRPGAAMHPRGSNVGWEAAVSNGADEAPSGYTFVSPNGNVRLVFCLLAGVMAVIRVLILMCVIVLDVVFDTDGTLVLDGRGLFVFQISKG